ncbi:MAG TPA: mechanosensitive ion channel domain-containing protein [Flavisolibacter sp.]|nr:mechanosensitive ion channel domain-containing protein [Flavisolibacter sp.]
MNSIWDRVLWNNTVRDWVIALGIIFAAVAALRFIQAVVISRIKKLTKATKTSLDDFIISVIQSSVMPLLYILAFYFGLNYLALPAKMLPILRAAMMVVITFFILKILTSFVSYAFRQAMKRHEGNGQREKQAKGILLIVQILLWGVGLLFLVDNLGYDITTLVAGLGIGGIAIALAAQTILGDLFSYLVIFFDKPFEIGDFIIVDEKMGTVEYIGIKTTHLRTLNGEQLIFSNTDLTNSRVHNYKRMQERRIVFSFGVVYDTPKEKLSLIPGWVRKIIESKEGTRFDRAHFLSFGDFSLNYEVVYYVLSPDFNTYMDIQQHINLDVLALFESEEIGFAFPTQTLYLNRAAATKVAKKQVPPA